MYKTFQKRNCSKEYKYIWRGISISAETVLCQVGDLSNLVILY